MWGGLFLSVGSSSLRLMPAKPLDAPGVAAARVRIAEARELLRLLGFDATRCNERSARVLLALTDLAPERPWAGATARLIGIHDQRLWVERHLDFDYPTGSREAFRKFTLNQFGQAGLVVCNPDKPGRAVNDGATCYQITSQALEVIRAYQSDVFGAKLESYLAEVPGLIAQYAAERDMLKIPVRFPGGAEVKLSPGGQNDLIPLIVDEFCPRFTPGGTTLYVGDARKKWGDDGDEGRKRLEELGVIVDEHGKMPDLVVYMPERNWLVLIEAALTHGPIDGTRHGELKELFHGSSAGLVFVSCFMTRKKLRSKFAELAWETDAWCADNRTHMVHLNGDRFLGPHDGASR